MNKPLAIHWFRQDLRLEDNPSLSAAVDSGELLPIYILDPDSEPKIGAASRWWLHHSLTSLNASLNNQLAIYQGDPLEILQRLCNQLNVSFVNWNRCYEPARVKADTVIKRALREQGVTVNSHSGSLLNEPWDVLKKDGTAYKIFTPFYNACPTHTSKPISKPAIQFAQVTNRFCADIDSLNLLPKIAWHKGIEAEWQPGEAGAHEALRSFYNSGIGDYKLSRDFPARDNTSHLSPHLHFGEISPRQALAVINLNEEDDNGIHFKREIIWRDFSYYLLYHWPNMPSENLKPIFNYFPWQHNQDYLKRWQQGLTGYPIVDAGMRELWRTGYMHNRVRMIAASFLIKNLLIDWRYGASWFWDCLVDADLASNSASWQWVAGCGTDASPYFRIFNPITQGEKFDQLGEYTKKHLPELKDLPSKYLFKPWQAPQELLSEAGITLGEDYPLPIVDIKESRQQALSAFKNLNELKAAMSVK